MFAVILVLCGGMRQVEAGCETLGRCCPGRDMTCGHVQDPYMPVARYITSAPHFNTAEVKASTSIHRGFDDTWHVHVDPRTDEIPGHGPLQSFIDSLHKLKAVKLAQLQLPEGYESKLTGEELNNVEEYLNLTESTPDYSSGEGSGEKNLTEESWKTIFGEKVPVQSELYADYAGLDPLIKYMIISDSIPISVERIANLRIRERCYCDEVCTHLHDCCNDYHSICPAMDCELSEWSGWGYCKSDEKCGVGISLRERRVLRQTQHGGLPCPELTESRVCLMSCQQPLLDEVALLLPYKFAAARVPAYNDEIYYDLPRHIAEYNDKINYCVLFEVDWLNPACKQREVREDLRESSTVCVQCHTNPLRKCNGEGVLRQKTYWNLIGGQHCTGRWRRTEYKQNCTCTEQFFTTPAYVFV